MKRILLSIFILVPYFSMAQTVIIGRVLDEARCPIAFANVVLLNRSDSAFIQGAVTKEDGTFSIATDWQNGLLKVSNVGYVTRYVDAKQGRMGDITLKPNLQTLGEVVVTGYKKLYEQKGTEIVAKVKGTVLETFPRASDVIAQLPFVSGQDGDFTVFGKGTPLIYINNRLVQDPEELNRLMSSQIKSISINTMPGAKYDATVNAVIRIITEKAQGEGLSGTLYAAGKRSKCWSAEEYASLNYRTGGWDFFGSAYLIQNRQKVEMAANQVLSVSDDIFKIGYQEQEWMRAKSVVSVAGVNYNPNPKNSTGLQYVFHKTGWTEDMVDDISHTVNDKSGFIRQVAYLDKPDKSHHINAYYSGGFGESLTFDANFDWMTGNDTNKMYSMFPDGSSDEVNTIGRQQYDLYTAKGVWTYSYEKLLVDAGAEWAYTKMSQTYDIDNAALGIDNSNDVTKQKRWAVFASAKFQSGNWGFGGGLRYEDIDFDYYKDHTLNEELSRVYHRLFPNVFASYSNENIQATWGYERKIRYPGYHQLRSNVQYSSPYVYESGNPQLLPQIQNAFTGMLSYKNLKVMLGYTAYEDYIAQLVELYKGQPVLLSKIDNVKGVKSSYCVISYTPAFGIWKPNVELGGQMLDFNYLGEKYNKPFFQLRANNTFTFPKHWTLNVDARWRSKGHSGIYLMKAFWRVDMRAGKQLLDNRLTVSVAANDIFRTEKMRWYINQPNIMFDYDKYNDSQYVQLTVRYDFNATGNKYKGSSSSDEIQRL